MKEIVEQNSEMEVRLPIPHFVDEETVVSARPVVPIAEARALDRLRLIRRALPFILTAAVIGILFGVAIGYYARYRRISSDAAPSVSNSKPANLETEIQDQTETKPGSRHAAETADADKQTVKVDSEQTERPSTRGDRKVQKRPQSPSPISNPKESRDRRNEPRGAGRIEEIFVGSDRP